MKSILRRAAVALLLMTLAAPVFLTGALALSNADPMLRANLDRADFEFEYTPPANSDYALYVFSEDGSEVQARAEILEDGLIIASGMGSGQICSAWLVAGKTYSMRVHGSGQALVEVARNTLSRCYDEPLDVREEEPAQKMIARSFDAHWYRFEAEKSGRLMLSCAPEDPGLRLSALLFDDAGALISRFESLDSGACMLLAGTRAGRAYYVRVYSPMGQEGLYSLKLNRDPEGGIVSALRFAQGEYELASGGALDLSPALSGNALLWDSDDVSVAQVSQSGVVTGLNEGEATITAYGLGSQAQCRVRVSRVAVAGIDVVGEEIALSAGDSTAVTVDFTPENASNRRVYYRVSDPQIASVSPQGVLKGLQAGETELTATSADGRFTDSVRVTVRPAAPRYRALLVGEHSYPFAESTERRGSENSVQALKSLLETSRFDSAAYAVTVGSDLSRAELIAEIREAFDGASEQDVSLFYITCHGSYSGGMSFLELSDGSSLSARDLERELRRIPGTVAVLIDCCGSGGAIGSASERAAFARGITGEFAGASVRGSKYKVLTSAGLDEDSFRIAFNGEAEAGAMATAFVRALCDGAGWNIDLNARGTMGADQDYDGRITLDEIYLYARGRVNWYLDVASALTGESYAQSVQVYPKGDPFVLFQRES